MEFSFGDEYKDGPLALGMHKRGSFHDVVNVDHCKIVHEDFTKILTATREYFAEKKVPFYKKLKHEAFAPSAGAPRCENRRNSGGTGDFHSDRRAE